jgi:hypothetical protein
MRLMRRSAASAWLSLGLAASAALGLGAVIILTAAAVTPGVVPAIAAVGNPPGGSVASVVPATTTPGSQVTFTVSCARHDTTAATLVGQTLGLPEQIPMDAKAADGDFTITVTMPMHTRPATYRPDIDCSDGTSTTAALTVTAFAAADRATTDRSAPSTAANTGLTTAGLVLIGIGAVAGGVAIRRRNAARSSGTR